MSTAHCPFISVSLSRGSGMSNISSWQIPEGSLSELLLDFSENIFGPVRVSQFKTRRVLNVSYWNIKGWKWYRVYQSRGFDFSSVEWFIPRHKWEADRAWWEGAKGSVCVKRTKCCLKVCHHLKGSEKLAVVKKGRDVKNCTNVDLKSVLESGKTACTSSHNSAL